MNATQAKRYGYIRTGIVSPITRAAWCPYCDHVERRSRRGNALATASRLRGAIMAHIRASHPDVLAEPEPAAAERPAIAQPFTPDGATAAERRRALAARLLETFKR